MKAQSSLEFLAMVSLSMLLLAVLYGVMTDRQVKAFQQERQSTAEAIIDKISFNVEMALVQGEGYSRVFSVPASIGGYDYSFSMGKGVFQLQWADRSIIRSTKYAGKWINSTVEDSNVYKTVHNSSGVFLVEQ